MRQAFREPDKTKSNHVCILSKDCTATTRTMAAPEPVDHLLNHYVTVTTNVLQTLADASNQTNDDYLIWTLLREELHRATQIHDDLHVASALFHAEAGDFRRTNVILDEEQHARSLCVQVQAKYEVHLQALNIQIVAPAHHNAQDGTNSQLPVFQPNPRQLTTIVDAAHEIGFSSDASSGISDDTPTSSEDGDNTSSALEADTTSGEVQCLGCTDSCHPDQAVSAACGHSYCATCATSFIKAAMSDRSIFPPTCCDKELLDVDQAKWFMTRDDSIRFDQISAEYYTIDPLYCAAPDCAAFLPGYEKQVICDGCGTTTCRDCGKHDHTGLCAVEEDLGTQQLRATAQAKGWKRCIGCTAMVERTTGCNQMTYVALLVHPTSEFLVWD